MNPYVKVDPDWSPVGGKKSGRSKRQSSDNSTLGVSQLSPAMPSKYVTRIKTGAKAPRSYDKMEKEPPQLPVPITVRNEEAAKSKRGRPKGRKNSAKAAAPIVIPDDDVSTYVPAVKAPRTFSTFVELHMECSSEPLSAAQLAAMNAAKERHERSVQLILAAKEGRLLFSEDGTPTILANPLPPPQAPQTPQIMPHQPLNITPENLMPGLHQANEPMMASPQTGGVFPQAPYPMGSPQLYRAAEKRRRSPSPDVMIVAETPPQLNPNWNARSKSKQSAAQPSSGVEPVQGTAGMGIRLPPGWSSLPASSKKSVAPRQHSASPTPVSKDETQSRPSRGRSKKSSDQEDGDPSGNWVPLDEYYYGKMEGNPTYVEEKGEFRFKCWYCCKMLYNNVAAMMHIQGHIDSERQVNLDLSDLTQCKHCYKSFDTPFEMQTHIEKVHRDNANVLICRICEKDHDSQHNLTEHMRKFHTSCEMPYTCQLCSFKSSMYSDVVDHFKKKHNSSVSMLCLYCLRVFQTRFVSQGWGQTTNYYNHVMKHQTKAACKKCPLCKLVFLNAGDLKNHRTYHHCPNQKGVISMSGKYSTPGQVMIKVTDPATERSQGGSVKSLNVPAVSTVIENKLTFYGLRGNDVKCIECTNNMATHDHFKKFIQCSMCRFATSCSFAYTKHMLDFHSGKQMSSTSHKPQEVMLKEQLYCLCGFSSSYGNKLASHLVLCSRRTCYRDRPPPGAACDEFGKELKDPRKKKDASLLDVLGLVKKDDLSASKSSRRESTPPPPPVDMPDVQLSDMPTKRPSLLKDAKKKSSSFKNILNMRVEKDRAESKQEAKGAVYTDTKMSEKKQVRISQIRPGTKEPTSELEKKTQDPIEKDLSDVEEEPQNIPETEVDKKTQSAGNDSSSKDTAETSVTVSETGGQEEKDKLSETESQDDKQRGDSSVTGDKRIDEKADQEKETSDLMKNEKEIDNDQEMKECTASKSVDSDVKDTAKESDREKEMSDLTKDDEEMKESAEVESIEDDKEMEESSVIKSIQNNEERKESTAVESIKDEEETKESASVEFVKDDVERKETAVIESIKEDEEMKESTKVESIKDDTEKKESVAIESIKEDEEMEEPAVTESIKDDKETKESAAVESIKDDEEMEESATVESIKDDEGIKESDVAESIKDKEIQGTGEPESVKDEKREMAMSEEQEVSESTKNVGDDKHKEEMEQSTEIPSVEKDIESRTMNIEGMKGNETKHDANEDKDCDKELFKPDDEKKQADVGESKEKLDPVETTVNITEDTNAKNDIDREEDLKKSEAAKATVDLEVKVAENPVTMTLPEKSQLKDPKVQQSETAVSNNVQKDTNRSDVIDSQKASSSVKMSQEPEKTVSTKQFTTILPPGASSSGAKPSEVTRSSESDERARQREREIRGERHNDRYKDNRDRPQDHKQDYRDRSQDNKDRPQDHRDRSQDNKDRYQDNSDKESDDNQSDNEQRSNYDNRNRGGYDNRSGGYDSNRGRGGYDNRDRGGYNNRGRGGYDNRGRGGYDNRGRGGYDNRGRGWHGGGHWDNRNYNNRGGYNRGGYRGGGGGYY